MCDALQELSDLSESLQADSLSLNKANRLIATQVKIFASHKTDGGEHYVTASEAVAAGAYCGVTIIVLSTAKSDKEIKQEQFYQALVDVVYARLMPESEKQAAHCIDVLFPDTWPVEYGKRELKTAASMF